MAVREQQGDRSGKAAFDTTHQSVPVGSAAALLRTAH